MFSRLLSFERPLGPVLVQLLYYIGIAGIIWNMVEQLWRWFMYFDNDWDKALWGVIKQPFIAIVSLMILRVLAEYLQAHFRMDKSMHDQVTGRAAPPKID